MAITNIGLLLREARRKKRLSLGELEEQTRIKKGFIKAIEGERWERLPEYPVVVGFVKNLASYLAVDRERAVALLRRDYPPERKNFSPKPERAAEFRWSPKLTFMMGVLGLILMVLGYLGIQYYKFISPPVLTVDKPVEGQVVSGDTLEVEGKVSQGAVVKVNNQPVVVDGKGKFVAEIELSEQTENVEVRAISRAERQTVVTRKIKVEFSNF